MSNPDIWYAIERTEDLSGNTLPEPVRKGVFVSAELASEYLGSHHGPYPLTAFRIAEISPLAPDRDLPRREAEPEAGL